MRQRVIHLQHAAPPKPAAGAVCNGCGVCCAAEPCPMGQWLSRRRHGSCSALTWSDDAERYHCGVLAQPGRWLPWLPAAAAVALARRWIAAGQGCDCDLEAQASTTAKATADVAA